MIGVRRTNRQQTSLPSSVLSADSMHIGVLAAAAHAAANRTPFTVFYNPRTCPTEFVIPAGKYRKAIYATQVSTGMRFGMMFETEDSGKRRYMGTIVGMSDLDPLRWPGSKWRYLQVEWDEPGCADKQNRVSAWEIETPESLFLFPSLTSGFKRSFYPGSFGGESDWGSMVKKPFFQFPDATAVNLPYASVPNIWSEQLTRAAMRSESRSYPGMVAPFPAGPILEEAKPKIQTTMFQKPQFPVFQSISVLNCQQQCLDQAAQGNSSGQEHSSNISNQPVVDTENTKREPVPEPIEQTSAGPSGEEKVTSTGSDKPVSHHSVTHENHKLMPPPAESCTFQPQWTDIPSSDVSSLNGLFPYMDAPEWPLYTGSFPMLGKISPTIPEVIDPSLPTISPDLWEQSQNLNSIKYSTHSDQFGSYSQLSDETNNQSGIYSCIDLDVPNGGSTIVGSSPSNFVLNNLCSSKDANVQFSGDCLIGNFDSTQDLQSQITSAKLVDSQAFLQDFPDSSCGGGTSSSNVDFDENSLLQNNSWQQVVPPMRTYTKVQKSGSVGRSIDVTSFKDYDELRSAIERMFGLEGLLNDPRGSGWKLVYVDFENDVLLVGDDPWEEFVSCVRCIRILSPSEVQDMSDDGMQLLSSNAIPPINGAA